jgi:TonB family protein
MSRLQKKCLIASGALHVLLLLVLLMTSAFLIKEEEPVDQQVLRFVPDRLVDEALRQPAAAQTAAQPTPVQPTPPPQTEPPPRRQEPPPKVEPMPPEPMPEPIKPRVEPRREPTPKPEPKVEPKKVDPPKPKPEPVRKPEPKPIELNLNPVVRSNADAVRKLEEQRAAELKRQAEAQREAQRRIDDAINRVSTLEARLTESKVGATAVDLGTVGVSYASYDSWVQKVYWDAWRPPNDIAAGRSIVKVKVVIRRDGTVESAVVTAASGTAALDNNIRQLLARVKTMGRPFPEGAKEAKRTYNIDFNLEAKLGSG